MFRFLTIALLAGVAIPAAAFAQDEPRGDHGRFREERPASDAGPRPERAPPAERQQRSFSREPATGGFQPRVETAGQSDQGWRGNRGGDGNRGGWNGNRGGDGNRGWRGGDRPATPPAVAAPPPVAQSRDRGERRNWSGGGDNGRRDWNRNDGQRGNWNRGDNDRRDWNRNDAQRRDWSDRRWDNNNDRRWDNNDRRWDGNRGASNWNRGWRNDRRYNWQGYRASNRYAYRWPTYYAPRGWNYGYRRFDIGTTLFAGLFAQNYWIGNPYDYRLPPVDWPYQWVRYYDDALLVDTETGQVVDVIPGIFW